MVPDWRQVLLIVIILVSSTVQGDDADENIAAARVESCRGCRLNRLPEVKKFVFEDVPLFENVEFKHIQGASPELVLLDLHDKELERIDLAPLSRQDCNDLLIKRGFLRKKADSEMHPNLQHEDF